MKRLLLFFIAIAIFSTLSAQQTDVTKRFKTAGGVAGFGYTISDNTDYNVYFLLGDFSWSFSKHPAKRDFTALYFEPQVNIVNTSRPVDLEFGANLGFRNYIRVNNGFYLYQSLGSGPHFITAKLSRQATGYIFSDNLYLGAMMRLRHSTFLNIQTGVRHISNAGLKLPNRGVNTIHFRIGLSKIK